MCFLERRNSLWLARLFFIFCLLFERLLSFLARRLFVLVSHARASGSSSGSMSTIAPPAATAEAAQPPAAADAATASVASTSIAAAAARLDAAAASLPAPGAAFLDASVSPEFLRDAREVRERSVKLLQRLHKVNKERRKKGMPSPSSLVVLSTPPHPSKPLSKKQEGLLLHFRRRAPPGRRPASGQGRRRPRARPAG